MIKKWSKNKLKIIKNKRKKYLLLKELGIEEEKEYKLIKRTDEKYKEKSWTIWVNNWKRIIEYKA
jgi:hypothetical protein